MTAKIITLTKLDAARRQLKTAIELWFNDGDPVSIHALAAAAYEIIHVISKKRNRAHDLIFDSAVVKEERRAEVNAGLKKFANFIKHARNDADATMQFDPGLPEMFILFAVIGVQSCNEPCTDEELAFQWWFSIHRPDLIHEKAQEILVKIDRFNEIKALSKRDFLQSFRDGRQLFLGQPLRGGL